MTEKIAAVISHNEKPLATLYTGGEITLLTKGTQVMGDISIDVLPGHDNIPPIWAGQCKVESIKQPI